jgi:hypothetical protein
MRDVEGKTRSEVWKMRQERGVGFRDTQCFVSKSSHHADDLRMELSGCSWLLDVLGPHHIGHVRNRSACTMYT